MSKLINDDKTLIYLGAETRTSKSGNNYTLVKIADTENYQQHQFFLSDGVQLNGLTHKSPVKIVLKLTTVGYQQRLELVDIKQLSK